MGYNPKSLSSNAVGKLRRLWKFGRGALTRTIRPPNAMRRQRGEPTRTMRPPNAMRRERGALTRTKTVLQPKADYATYGCYAKRARQADADYATSERDAMRARRADADQKNLQPSPSSGCVFIVVSVVRPSNRKTVQAPLVMWLTCISGCWSTPTRSTYMCTCRSWLWQATPSYDQVKEYVSQRASW